MSGLTTLETIDELSMAMVQRASLLTQLIQRHARTGLSRSEASVISTLSQRDGAQRISTLAYLEGLSQPAVTLLVKRLEQRGFVRRDRDEADGRVVLVSLTDVGFEMLERVRGRYRALLRECLAELSEEQLDGLRAGTEALGLLVNALQEDEPPA